MPRTRYPCAKRTQTRRWRQAGGLLAAPRVGERIQHLVKARSSRKSVPAFGHFPMGRVHANALRSFLERLGSLRYGAWSPIPATWQYDHVRLSKIAIVCGLTAAPGLTVRSQTAGTRATLPPPELGAAAPAPANLKLNLPPVQDSHPRLQSVTGGFAVNTDARKEVRGYYNGINPPSDNVAPPEPIRGRGAVPGTPGHAAANLTYVSDPSSFGARPATRQPYVAWPPERFVPYQVTFPYWSFGLSNAELSAATVAMTSNGVPVTTAIQPYETDFGENTLVGVPMGLPPRPAARRFPSAAPTPSMA